MILYYNIIISYYIISDNIIVILFQSRTLALTDGENQDLSLTEPLVQAERKSLTIDISQAKKKVEVVPILSPTSITIDKAGLPLAIFTKVLQLLSASNGY